MTTRRVEKLNYLYDALKDGWHVEMVKGKNSNVWQLTGRLSQVATAPKQMLPTTTTRKTKARAGVLRRGSPFFS